MTIYLAVNAVAGQEYGHLQVVFEGTEIEVQPTNQLLSIPGIQAATPWLVSLGDLHDDGYPAGDYARQPLTWQDDRTEEEVWALLLNIADEISSKNVNYWNEYLIDQDGNLSVLEALTQNSNSFVRTLLDTAGIDFDQQLTLLVQNTNVTYVPGISRNVLFSHLVPNGTDPETFSEGPPVELNLSGTDAGERVFTGDGNDTLMGGLGNDVLFSGNGSDEVVGDAGRDVIVGGQGIDQLRGGADEDLVYFDASDTTVLGGETGDDFDHLVFDSNIYDTEGAPTGSHTVLTATAEDLEAEMLVGGSGSDTLTTTSNAMLGGGDGEFSDTLIAMDRSSTAILWGGDGADEFIVPAGSNIYFLTVENLSAETFLQLTPEALLEHVPGEGLLPFQTIILNPDDQDAIIFRYLDSEFNLGTDVDQPLEIISGAYDDRFVDNTYGAFDNPFYGATDIDGVNTPATGSLVWEGLVTGSVPGSAYSFTAQGHGSYFDGFPWPELFPQSGLNVVGDGYNPTGGWMIAGGSLSGSTITTNEDATTGIQLSGSGDDSLTGIENLIDIFYGSDGIDDISNIGPEDMLTFTNSSRRKNIDLEAGNASDSGGNLTSFAGLQNAVGSTFGDTIIGSALSNELFGGEGGDSVDGGAGDDSLSDGAGDDMVTGGEGADTFNLGGIPGLVEQAWSEMQHAAENGDYDIVTDFDPDEDTLFINGVEITGSFGGSAFSAVQSGGSVIIAATQGAFSHTVELENMDLATWSSMGGETIDGTSGNDTINEFYVDADGEAINDFGQTILTGDGTDVVYDGTGDDTVVGGSGMDRFYAGFGADSYDGGGDNRDEVLYMNAVAGLIIDMVDSTNSTGEAAGDTYISIERIRGTNFDDEIYLAGDTDAYDARGGDDLIVDGTGDNFMKGGAGSDTFRFVAGDGHEDRINDFSIGEDLIDISAWGVTLMSQLTFAQRTAGNGDPLPGLIVSAGSESLRIDNLNDADIPYLTADHFVGVTDDTGSGGGGSNGVVDGTSGNDVIDTGYVDADGDSINNGGQTILSGDGDDKIYDGAGDDTVVGGSGLDRFYAGMGADSYDGASDNRDEVLYIYAATGLTIDMTNSANSTGEAAGDTYTSIERIRATNYDDIIYLSGDVDLYDGRAGDDVIHDAMGNNFMRGGAGADTFVFVVGDGHQDRINDFSIGEDLIDISAWGASGLGDLTMSQRTNGAGDPIAGLIVDYGVESIRIDNLNETDIASLTAENFVFL